MKNKRIIDSWSKIKPDSAADARMLNAILARRSGKTVKERVCTAVSYTHLDVYKRQPFKAPLDS